MQKYLDKRKFIFKTLLELLDKIKKPAFHGGKKFLSEVGFN